MQCDILYCYSSDESFFGRVEVVMASLCIEEMKAHYLQFSSTKSLNEGEFIAIDF
jgi:hypothetical protein